MEKKENLQRIKFIPNGPILVEGEVELTLSDGNVIKEKSPHLCRCGASNKKPYCDGSHAKVGFKD